MLNKLEKIIHLTYWSQITLCVYIIVTAFITRIHVSTVYLSLFFLPLFFVLFSLYKKKHKLNFKSNYKNSLAKNLLITSIIVFITSLIISIILLNLINIDNQTNYNIIYNDQIKINFTIITVICGFIWTVIILLFAINFYSAKKTILRYYNLKYVIWSMFVFGFLIAFIKLFSLLIYDTGLFIKLSLFN